MTTNETETTSGVKDTALLALAALLIVGALAGYYYFASASVVLRVLGILVAIGGGLALSYQTYLGRQAWRFIQGSRVEIRKVVWPTRQEAVQTTIAVFVFLLVLGVFFWSLDAALLFITRRVTGQGS